MNVRKMVGLAVAAMLLADGAVQAARYEITDLGSLVPNSSDSSAYALNNNGHVVGQASGQAVLWRDNATINVCPFGEGSYAFGISDSDLVVGIYLDMEGDQEWHGFKWEEGVASEFPMVNIPFAGGGSFSPVSSAGLVVGTTTGSVHYLIDGHSYDYTVPRVGVWDNGSVHDIGPTDGHAFASTARGIAISDSGDYITGYGGHNCFQQSEGQHAMLMTLDGAATDIGNLSEYRGSAGFAVNNHGHVVGSGYVESCAQHGFFWDGGR
jgi:uncharacterized membrane protein